MKFSSTEDIAAPIDAVFQLYSDFDGFERAALRRGADVTRTDSKRTVGAGSNWKVNFMFRGKRRNVLAEIVDFNKPDGYSVDADTPNLKGMFTIEIVPLSRTRTRVSMGLEIKPKSLTGRLMIQSLKLGKSKLTRQFKVKSAEFAKAQEIRFASGNYA